MTKNYSSLQGTAGIGREIRQKRQCSEIFAVQDRKDNAVKYLQYMNKNI